MKKPVKNSVLKILVVDDEILIARNLQRTLIDLGHVVPDVACSGEDAIAKVEAHIPDLIFMDIRLASGLDGIEAARLIKERFSVPVIFLTAYADEETLSRAREVGPYGYLVKPVAERDIRIIIEVAVGRRAADQMLRESEAALQKAKEELECKVKERTAQLEEANADLAASNADLQQFAYVASHDLREPLRMVVIYLQYLERRSGAKFDTEDKEFIDLAIDGATRMQALVQDLLVYAKIGKDGEHPVTVDLNAAVAEAETNIGAALKECGAQINRAGLPSLPANQIQMVQLFQNLISNAVKYRSASPPKIDIDAQEENGEWTFSVSDNGIGIGPEYREKVFEIFQRLHSDREKYPGTGIGLSICKKIVDRHRGRIWVESQPGKGSAFYFTLPLGAKAAASSFLS